MVHTKQDRSARKAGIVKTDNRKRKGLEAPEVGTLEQLFHEVWMTYQTAIFYRRAWSIYHSPGHQKNSSERGTNTTKKVSGSPLQDREDGKRGDHRAAFTDSNADINRGQVLTCQHQKPHACDLCSEQQYQSGQECLTHRELWEQLTKHRLPRDKIEG